MKILVAFTTAMLLSGCGSFYLEKYNREEVILYQESDGTVVSKKQIAVGIAGAVNKDTAEAKK